MVRLIPMDEAYFGMLGELGGLLREAATQLAALLAAPEPADPLVHTIRHIENRADELKHESELFAGSPDPLDVLRRKSLYDKLEDAIDECDDVANVLERIVKHT